MVDISAVIAIFGGIVRTTKTLVEGIKSFGDRLHIANENKTEWKNLANAYHVLLDTLPDYEAAVKGAISSDDFLSDLDRGTLKIHLNELHAIMNTATDKFSQIERRLKESNTEQASHISPHPVALSPSTGLIPESSLAGQNSTASNYFSSCNLFKLCTSLRKGKGEEKTSAPLEKQTTSQKLENKRDVLTHANRDRETITGLKENKKEAHVKLDEIRKLLEEKYGSFRKHYDSFQSPHFKDIRINYNDNTHESKLKQAITNTNPETNHPPSSSQPVSVCVQGQGGMGKTTALRHICTAPGVKEQYPDGIHFMTIGEDTQPQHIINSISKCIENSGFSAVASKIREAEKVEDATKMGSIIFRDRSVLLIVDDWHPPHSKHVKSFEGMLSESKNGLLLISTRSATISKECTRKIRFDPLSPIEPIAKSILLQHIFHNNSVLAPDAKTAIAVERILEICGGIKLLLAMAGRGIRVQRPEHASVAVRIKRYLERLVSNEEKNVSKKDEDIYDKSYKQVILTNLKYCNEEIEEQNIKWKFEGKEVKITKAEDLFKGFCVVEKQQRVPLGMICRLWRTKKSVTKEVLYKLEDWCLLTMYYEKRSNTRSSLETHEAEITIELHDTVIDVARYISNEENKAGGSLGAVLSSCSRWHEWLLDGYLSDLGGSCFEEENESTSSQPTRNRTKLSERICRPKWWNLETEEEYFVQNVTRHLNEGHMLNELSGLLSNVEWTLKRIEIGGWAALESDLSKLEELSKMSIKEWKKGNSETTNQDMEVKGIGVLRDALRTSWGIICENPHSLGFEMFGRIPNEDRKWKIVNRYMKSIEEWGLKPWLRPVTASLRKWDGREVNQIVTRGLVKNLCYTEGKVMVIAENEEQIFVYSDVFKQEEPVVIQKSEYHGMLWSAAFCSKSNYFACGLRNGEIRIHDGNSGALVGHPMSGHEGVVKCVAMSDDGQRVVSGSDDNTVRVWDVETSEQVGYPMTGHEDMVLCVAVTDDGQRVVSGSKDKTVRVWDVESSEQGGNPMTGHEDWVRWVALNDDGRRVVSGSRDKTVRVWDVETSSQVGKPMTGHEEWVECVAISDNGRRVVSGSWDKTVRVWDVKNSKQVGDPMTGHELVVRCAAMSDDGRRVVSGSWDKTVRVWAVETSSQVGHPMTGHEELVECVAMSNDGGRVVSGSWDKTVRVWDVESSKQVGHPMTGHELVVRCAAISDDGRRVVSGSWDKTVRVWDVESSKQMGHPMTGHEDVVVCVALSDDGRRVVSGSHDKTVRVWDVESSEQVGHTMTGHDEWVECVAMSDDGRRVVSGSWDKTVRVWDVESSLQISISFPLPDSLEDKRKEREESVEQIYTEWLHKLVDELVQDNCEQERRVSVVSLHQDVSKVTRGFGLHFNLSVANPSNGCELEVSTDVDTNIWHSLSVDRESVRVEIAGNEIVKVATLPMQVRCYTHRGKATVHGCEDGRVVICKLEE